MRVSARVEDSSQGAVVSGSVRMLLRSDAVHNSFFPRQSQRKLPSRLGYICTPHWLLFRSLKGTDFHDATVLTGPGLFKPGADL